MRVMISVTFTILASTLIWFPLLPFASSAGCEVQDVPETRETIDVGVTNISIEPGPYHPEFYPLVPILFKSKIVNFGDNISGNFTVLFTVSDSPYQANQTVSNFTSSEEMNLEWNFTPQQIGDHVLVITSLAPDDSNALNNQLTQPISVVDSGYHPQLVVDDNSSSASPGKACEFHITVKNEGTKADEFDISIDSVPWGWNASLSDDDISLAPAAEKVVTLTVNLTSDHQRALEGIEYVTSLSVLSRNYPYVTTTERFVVVPVFQPLLGLDAPSTFVVPPNSTVDYMVTIFNGGNGNDSASLVAAFASEDENAGWTIYASFEEHGPIEVNGSQEVRLTLGAPLTAAGSVATLSLSASSIRGGTLPGGSLQIFRDITMGEFSNPRFFDTPNEVSASPGSTVPVTLSIVNHGNILDDTIDIYVSSSPPDWDVQIDRSGIPDNGLEMHEMGVVVISLTVPGETIRGTYEVKLNLTGGVPSETRDQLSLIVSVWNHTEGHHIKATSLEETKSAYNGETVVFTLIIENTGTFDESLDLNAYGTQEEWDQWTSLDHGTLNIGMGSSKTIDLSVTIPLDVPADADLSTNVKDPYGFQIVGTSNLDPTNWTFQSQVFIEITPFYDFDLQVGSTTITTIREDTRKFEIHVTLVNTGNSGDTMTVFLEGPQWATLESIHPDPGFSESATIGIWCEHPADIQVGDHPLDLLVRSQGDPGKERSLRITVSVVSFDFMVQEILIHGESGGEIEINRESPLQIKATVTNIGESDFDAEHLSNLSVEIYIDDELIGERDLASLRQGQSVPVTVLWDDPTEGSHRVYATIDAQDMISEANENNNRVEMEFSISFTPSDGVTEGSKNTPIIPVPKEVMVLTTTSLATLLTLLLIFTTEFGLYAALTLVVPLYTRLSRKQILDNYLRGKIHGYIIANPGDNFTSIKKRLGITNGTFAYHLRLLEKEGLIKSRRDGKLKRFYPMGMKIPDPTELPLTDIQEEILDAINGAPGLSQKQIAQKIDHSVQVVNYHLKSMEAAHLVRLVKVGRMTRCYGSAPK